MTAKHKPINNTITKEAVKKALINSAGIVSTVASRLKCDWHTAEKYIHKYELFEELQGEKERILDIAESKLVENIQRNDVPSIFFVLKCLGKKRGYIERQEISGADGNPVFEVNINKKD